MDKKNNDFEHILTFLLWMLKYVQNHWKEISTKLPEYPIDVKRIEMFEFKKKIMPD